MSCRVVLSWRFVLLGLCFLLKTPTAFGQEKSLAGQIAFLLHDPAVARDHWGIMVTAFDGTSIYRLNEAQLFQPASNAKLFTTAAAIALLGTGRRFTTRVEYGFLEDGGKTIHGDLTIIGNGDSSLSSPGLPYRSPNERKALQTGTEPLSDVAGFADRIVASGVTHITGDVVGDDTAFPWEPYPLDWSIDDMVWGYGAPISALTIQDNQLSLRIRAAKTIQEVPTIELQAGAPAYYEVVGGDLKTGAAKTGNHVLIERGVGSKLLQISGSIATDALPDQEEIAVADPAEFAARALRATLEKQGVQVDGIARSKHRAPSEHRSFLEASREPLPKLPKQPISTGTTSLLDSRVNCFDTCPTILQHTSPIVEEDIVFTNKTSQNLHAELLLHHLGKVFGADGSTAQGARVIRQFLLNAGLDKDDFVFFDGSGLSGHDLVTPRATAKLLLFAATQPWFAAWKASLPIGGVDGSLEGRFTQPPLKGHVFAKTGTLGEARALSGYLDCASGKTVIFSIFAGNHLPTTSADREAMDRIVAAIAAAN